MTPFEETLNQFNINLSKSLNSDYTKINVQGCHKPNNTQLVFTIFDKKYNYHMEFLPIKNLRMYRIDGDIEFENESINKYITIIKNALNKYL